MTLLTRDWQIPYMQARHLFLLHIWRLDLAIQPSITAIPREPGCTADGAGDCAVQLVLMIEKDLILEVKRVIQQAETGGVRLRVLGGLAVYLYSPSADTHPALKRSYADMDLVGLGRQGRQISDLLVGLGYESNKRFNALHGETRLIFYDTENNRQVDIFLDHFQMCHTLDLRQRLLDGYLSLPLADLLITKLQIRELNAKDLQDTLVLLLDHEPGTGECLEWIDLSYLGRLVRNDWGLFTTLSDNLERARQAAPEYLSTAEAALVQGRIDKILGEMQAVPKSVRWKMRARIGRRMEWYELPEEVNW